MLVEAARSLDPPNAGGWGATSSYSDDYDFMEHHINCSHFEDVSAHPSFPTANQEGQIRASPTYV